MTCAASGWQLVAASGWLLGWWQLVAVGGVGTHHESALILNQKMSRHNAYQAL